MPLTREEMAARAARELSDGAYDLVFIDADKLEYPAYVEQGVRFFRDAAFLEEGSARREAERGTFDPTYLVYSAGKLALLKLREDWHAEQGGKPVDDLNGGFRGFGHMSPCENDYVL